MFAYMFGADPDWAHHFWKEEADSTEFLSIIHHAKRIVSDISKVAPF
jgi:hypothetical protein